MKESAINRDALLTQVKQAVYGLEPDAEIILYGSHSRGDATAESDWDFLILVDGVVNWERTDKIRHRLYEIEWECGEVLSSIVKSRQEWYNSPYRVTPLYHNITLEGIRL
jgi:predicted nucleotidyltransferase